MRPIQTSAPCVANKAWFFPEDKKFRSWLKIMIRDTNAQVSPAKATVVNFGVSFLHLKLTENIAKPMAEIIPNINPKIEPVLLLPKAIIIIPIEAIVIDIQTLNDIFSFKNKNPNKAVIKGIAAKQSKVIAAEVLVIDQINEIIASARPNPPITPDNPIFK